jgi:hypothetical protein
MKNIFKNKKGNAIEFVIMIPLTLFIALFFGEKVSFQGIRSQAQSDIRVALKSMVASETMTEGLDNFCASLESTKFAKKGKMAAYERSKDEDAAIGYCSKNLGSGYDGFLGTGASNYHGGKYKPDYSAILSRYFIFYDFNNIVVKKFPETKFKYHEAAFCYYADGATYDDEKRKRYPNTCLMGSLFTNGNRNFVNKIDTVYWASSSFWSAVGIKAGDVRSSSGGSQIYASSYAQSIGNSNKTTFDIWQKGIVVEVNYVVKNDFDPRWLNMTALDGNYVEVTPVFGEYALITERATIQ